MPRREGGGKEFAERNEHLRFLHRLGEVCQRRNWRVPARVLVGNHSHP